MEEDGRKRKPFERIRKLLTYGIVAASPVIFDRIMVGDINTNYQQLLYLTRGSGNIFHILNQDTLYLVEAIISQYLKL